jgi:hypothetical protein
MEPLQIDIRLSTAMMLPSHPIHLDALLAWAAVERGYMPEVTFREALGEQDNLPLQTWEHEGVSGYCASCLFLCKPDVSPEMLTMVRRPEFEEFANRRRTGHAVRKNTFPEGTGHYKLFCWHNPMRHYQQATAWCIGDASGVLTLLDELQFVGRMSRNGFGRIQSVTVTPAEEAKDKWRLRNLPDSMPGVAGATYMPGDAAVRPPYWKRLTFVPAKMPVDWY